MLNYYSSYITVDFCLCVCVYVFIYLEMATANILLSRVEQMFSGLKI